VIDAALPYNCDTPVKKALAPRSMNVARLSEERCVMSIL
jgi:hypothetical protein